MHAPPEEPRWRALHAHPGKVVVTSRRNPPNKEEMMANIPGAVTDPSRRLK